MERLSKFVARMSLYSRRKAEELIRAGKVKINNITVREPYAQVETTDVISIQNRVVETEPVKLYIALYKPEGYMSDLQDTKERKVARSLIRHDLKLYPVGRLDYHSEGLMIFTNDGEFANETMHPRYGIEKEYLVKFKGLLTKDTMNRMRVGLKIKTDTADSTYAYTGEDSKVKNKRPLSPQKRSTEKTGKEWDIYKVDDIHLAKAGTKNGWYRIVVSEGKNRMIRKMGEAVGHQVLKLKRIRIGGLELGDLKPGEYRYFEKKEIKALKTGQKKHIRVI